MKNRVPFDVAFAVDDAECDAWGIIFAEFEGNEFDDEAMAFKKNRGS